MLNVVVSASSGQAKQYYTQGLSREDYYSEGQEIIGEWQGLGAERLGLHGKVDQLSFDALADNLKPGTDENLTVRTKENRRVGYDFTFSCPKSVSVVYEHNQDERIFQAFKMSVTDTMRELESDIKTRVRVKGQDCDRKTGNMVWAEFHHFTARPVGGIPDPQMHAHCFAFNATWDDVEKRWKAGQFGDLKREAPYYEAAFHARFAKRVADMGYDIERTEKRWEIAGMPESVLNKFQERTKQIETMAAERGITSAKEKAALAALSREGKRHGISKNQLREIWDGRLTVEEKGALRKVHENGQELLRPEKAMDRNRVTAKTAMDYAVAHCYERASVTKGNELLREALRFGVGAVDVEEVKRQLLRGEFLNQESGGQRWYTTGQVLTEEQKLLDFVNQGKGACAPLGRPEYQIKNPKLLGDEGREQRDAVRHILNSRDRVIAVRGGAGTGKTTMLKEAVAGIEAGGRRVFAFAPSAEASRGVLQSEGFQNATTVAALLQDARMQERVRDGVLLIDEAGLLSSPQLKRVADLAQRQNCRVVLSGDTAQHGAVERGDALRLLETHAGLQAVELKNIRRQANPTYRDAVADLRQGNIEKGFAKLDQLGAISEITSEERYKLLAADYVQAVKDKKSALVVSPTHAEGERVTGEIRGELKALKKVGTIEREVIQLKNLRLTEAERSDGRSYVPGMVIQFHQNAPGFRRGERATVLGRVENQISLRHANGTTSALDLDRHRGAAAHFNVYSSGALPVASGDRIRITQNGNTKDGHRINNGELYTVKNINEEGDLILTNGRILPKDFGNLAHGYCVTSHSSQGKTIDRLFVAESEASLPAASREQFYVSASRGVEAIKVYTDNKEALMAAVAVSGQRPTATDLAKGALPQLLKEKEKVRMGGIKTRLPRSQRLRQAEQQRLRQPRQERPLAERETEREIPLKQTPDLHNRARQKKDMGMSL